MKCREYLPMDAGTYIHEAAVKPSGKAPAVNSIYRMSIEVDSDYRLGIPMHIHTI